MKNFGRSIGTYMIIFIVVLSLSMMVRSMAGNADIKEVKFSQFANHLEKGQYESINITDRRLVGTSKNGKQEVTYAPSLVEISYLEDKYVNPMLEAGTIELDSDPPKGEYTLLNLLPTILMIAAMGFLFYFMMSQGGNKQAFQFGKNRARLYKSDAKAITFKDVAGLDEEKQELQEVVDFLKNPQKYTALGGKIPKGALLVGPPGTGKTLLAKAVAGESGVPFYSISGSDFVEMYVGVGASRVRDLFETAKKTSPCIIFIDEIDAIALHRSFQSLRGDVSEIVNSLLTEMDGINPNDGVVTIAATNNPSSIDFAIRSRFEEEIEFKLPNDDERREIFELNLNTFPMDYDLDIEKLVKLSKRMSGRDIKEKILKTALHNAIINDKEKVTMDDIYFALDINKYKKEEIE